MAAGLLLILTAVTLTGPFGEATATAVQVDGSVAVTVEVEVDASFAADYVVVHVLNPDGQETVPLGRSTAGRYGGTFRIAPFNRAVVFEAGRADEFAVSETVSLIDMGVDVGLLQTTFAPETTGSTTRQWGWLVLAAAALAGVIGLGWMVRPRTVPAPQSAVETTGGGEVDGTD